jgi:peptide chain release factor subunit 1
MQGRYVLEEADEAEKALFKKKLKRLAKIKGTGTELISLYIPPDSNRGAVMSQLTTEISQSSNIKDPKTRKNVQGALRKVISFLKRIDFKIPPRGLAIFCGNISQQPGRSDIRLFAIHPVKRLTTKLYWCDSQFNLEPLKEMVAAEQIYGIITIDKNEATIALLKGKTYEILGNFKSRVAGKIRAGGQSAKRFEHLREEAEHNFYKKVSEKANAAFLPIEDKLQGIIVSGPGLTKEYFLEEGLLDHRLKKKIVGKLSVSYTDEAGIRETISKLGSLIKDLEIVKEREALERFYKAVVRDNMGVYGEKDVLEALDMGKLSLLLISEALEKRVFTFQCECGATKQLIVDVDVEPKQQTCKKCGRQMELIEEQEYSEYLMDKAQAMGTETRMISTDTEEGKQFLDAFGGIGGILRYR